MSAEDILLPELNPRAIPEFRYAAPSTLDQALSLLNQYGQKAKVLSGGSDLFYLMKRDAMVVAPEVLVDIKGISALNYLDFNATSGLSMGALTNISALETSQDVLQNYPVLAQAAGKVASPQVRNVATVGGALCQQVWCWFLRSGLKCWRAGGNDCFAVMPGADNRYYHSVMGGRECYAVHPSDLAVAIKALDASITVASSSGTTTMTFDQFMPGNAWVEGVLQSHVLQSNQLLTAVTIPAPKPNTRSAYIKTAIRDVLDFAIASSALVLTLSGNTITDSRVVFGGIAPAPYRDVNVEAALNGKQLSSSLTSVVDSEALKEASPLENNAYKVDVAKGTLKEAIVALSS
jgi:xanthine dehydrogenase YagS FAD-binding subunit